MKNFIKISEAFFWGLLAVFIVPQCEAVEIRIHHKISDSALEAELDTIIGAAERNNCTGDDFWLLLAIRKAENGAAGREFGVLHPRCLQLIREQPGKSLDIQAGWAAATIVKNRKRWLRAGGDDGFINFLGDRYCPAAIDPQGNVNWKRNVRYWFDRLLS